MIKIREHIEKLGYKGVDKVTGFKGVVTSASFDLFGCLQLVICPQVDDDGKSQEGRWVDAERVKITSKKRVMPLPDFDSDKGPAEKPIP